MVYIGSRLDNRGNSGVSPVVGVILVVAITVALAAVIGAFVLDLSGNSSEPSSAAVTIAEGEHTVEVSAHQLNDETVTVLRNGEETEHVLSSTGETVTIYDVDEGDTISVRAGGVNDGEIITQQPLQEVNPAVIVRQDGTGDYQQIQPAVNDTEAGHPIIVEGGPYEESVVIDKTVDLRGRSAVVDSSTTTQNWSFNIGSNADTVKMDSFEIRGAQHGIFAEKTDASFIINDATFDDANIAAFQASGGWTLTNSDLDSMGSDTINAGSTTGTWEIRNTRLGGDERLVNATFSSADWQMSSVKSTVSSIPTIRAPASEGDWTVRNSDFAGMVDTPSATGSWRIINTTVDVPSGSAINSPASTGSWTVRGSTINSSLDVASADSDWTIENSDISSETGSALFVPGTSGTWTVTDTTLTDGGVSAPDSSGDWTVEHVEMIGVTDDAFYTPSATGDWTISQVTASGVDTFAYMNGFEGQWSIERTASTNIENQGISAPTSPGNLTLTDVTFTGGNASTEGIFGPGTDHVTGDNITVTGFDTGIALSTSTWEVHSSKFTSNNVSVDNYSPYDADFTENWWGDSSGPSSDDTTSGVLTDPYCTNEDCTSLSG